MGQETRFDLPILPVFGETTEDIALQFDMGMELLAASLLPSGSPFGDPGPHGDLFQFLGPQKVPIFS